APFDPRLHPEMGGTILVGVFAFCLAVSLAIAARRAGLAVVTLLVGAGWPATLVTGGNELGRGAVILLAVLALLVSLTRRPAARARALRCRTAAAGRRARSETARTREGDGRRARRHASRRTERAGALRCRWDPAAAAGLRRRRARGRARAGLHVHRCELRAPAG